MKTMARTAAVAALTLICTMFLGFTPQNDLARLWKEYDAAGKADLPQTQLEVLEKIKKVALAGDCLYDFYRAGELTAQVRSAVNWKDRQQAYSDFESEINGAAVPVLSFFYRSTHSSQRDLLQYVEEHRKELESGIHSEFHSKDRYIPSLKYGPAVKPADDYEYALWSILGHDGMNARLSELLSEKCGNAYPKRAFIDYSGIARNASESDVTAFMKKYEGKAAALMAEEDLLQRRYNEMSEAHASSDEYRSFRKRCEDFEKRRKAFAGEEKLIAGQCTRAKLLIEDMDSRSISFSVSDGVLEARLANVSEMTVKILKDSKVVLTGKVTNTKNSYHVADTVTWTVPDMNDGEYRIECSSGKVKHELQYSRHAYSIAMKSDRKGTAIFLADAKSGKPVEKADIIIAARNGKTTNTIKAKDFRNGFIYLPESLTRKDEPWRYEVYCRGTSNSGHELNSERLSLSAYEEAHNERYMSGIVMKDRAAFHPGEEVQFKAIAFYNGSEFRTVDKDTKIKAILRDPEYNEIATLDLLTNEFGSVSGSFRLEAERNGRFSLEIMSGQQYLASTDMVVDEFVLPTFDLETEEDNKLYLPGDEVPLRGRLISYSGHSLASAKIACTISCNGHTETRDIVPESDGSFCILYKTDPEKAHQYINYNIAVTDATGETLDWDRSRNVSSYISLYLDAEGTSSGSCSKVGNIFSNDDILYRVKVSGGSSSDARHENLSIGWKLTRGEMTVKEGSAKPGDELKLDMRGLESGIYELKAEALVSGHGGKDIKAETSSRFILLRDGDKTLDQDIDDVFKLIEGDDIAVQFGAGNGPVWMVVEIYGSGNVPLVSKLLNFGKDGESFLDVLRFEFRKEWSDKVLFKAFYFRNGQQHEYSHLFDRSEKAASLPLEFTRFEDKTAPGKTYSFQIRSKAGVECLAAIFDKSSESMAGNVWSRAWNWSSDAPGMYYSVICGKDETGWGPVLYRTSGSRRMLSANGAFMDNMAVMEEAVFEAPMMKSTSVQADMSSIESAESESIIEDIQVREDFSTTIAFEPFLRSDSDGMITLDFTNKDKLSTFVVSLFAHDMAMNNAVLRREMIVTVPVKVSTVEPQLLYCGDSWQLRASLSSNVEEAVSGSFRIEKGSEVYSEYVTIPAGNEILCTHELRFEEVGTADIKISFIPDDKTQGGDAIMIHIPVVKAAQTITESHSALFKPGMSRDEIIRMLRKQFVNHNGADAVIREISIMDLIKEAVPSQIADVTADTYSPDAITLSRSLYARMLCEELGVAVDKMATDNEIAKLLDCVCADGGFAWFAGMESSSIVTATVIYRIASVRARGHALSIPLENAVKAAAAYLDDQQFSAGDRPYWRGGLSMEQYLYVRSLVPEVSFDPEHADRKVLSDFRKEAGKFLTPSKDRGTKGEILAKARRIIILDNLCSSEDGIALAKAWGIRSNTSSRLEKSSDKDIASLVQYAVEHKSGGMYFPNAVMPFRGLMESEAHAHALLCELLDRHGYAEIAEGLRIWLMVQKESQKWNDDPGFIEALAAVMKGSANTLNMSVLTLSCSSEIPFSKIKASGNGMKISRSYYRFVNGEKKELKPGDELKLGERILAEYNIHNDENRSFGRIYSGRPACMRPVDQLSGYRWNYWGCYRIVRASGTEYLMDVLPEENLTYSEEFFVTQAGTFTSPVVTVESLYAPHYRANDGYRKASKVR